MSAAARTLPTPKSCSMSRRVRSCRSKFSSWLMASGDGEQPPGLRGHRAAPQRQVAAGPAGGGVDGFDVDQESTRRPTRLWPHLTGCAAFSSGRTLAVARHRGRRGRCRRSPRATRRCGSRSGNRADDRARPDTRPAAVPVSARGVASSSTSATGVLRARVADLDAGAGSAGERRARAAVARQRRSPTDGELTRRPAATEPRPVRPHGGGALLEDDLAPVLRPGATTTPPVRARDPPSHAAAPRGSPGVCPRTRGSCPTIPVPRRRAAGGRGPPAHGSRPMGAAPSAPAGAGEAWSRGAEVAGAP